MKGQFEGRGYSHFLGNNINNNNATNVQNAVHQTPASPGKAKQQGSRQLSCKRMMKSKNKMTTNSINNYHHHQSSQYLQRKKRRNVAMRKSRGEVEAKGEMQEEEGFGVKEMEKIGLRVEVVVRSLEGRAGREKGGRRWGKYLERLETFAEMLIGTLSLNNIPI